MQLPLQASMHVAPFSVRMLGMGCRHAVSSSSALLRIVFQHACGPVSSATPPRKLPVASPCTAAPTSHPMCKEYVTPPAPASQLRALDAEVVEQLDDLLTRRIGRSVQIGTWQGRGNADRARLKEESYFVSPRG